MEQSCADNIIGLRKEAGRHRSLHQRAVKRLEEQRRYYLDKMERLKADYELQLEAAKATIVELKTQVRTLQNLHFGKPGEAMVSVAGDLTRGQKKSARKRGQQPGREGHGRRPHDELACVDEELTLSAEEARCPVCGLPAEATTLVNASEEVDYEVRIVRRRRRRVQYRRTCQCEGVSQLMSAPLPPRALPQSKYSDAFWIEILLFKYEYQLPLERVIRHLDGHGLHKVASGTLCGGIERCGGVLQPLFAEFVRYDKSRLLRLMDETTMKVFIEVEGRTGHLWWLWQSSTPNTCIFFLDPTRSFDVPSQYLADTPKDSVICADRYVVYKKLEQALAFCWAHVRRDFVRIGRSHRGSLNWALRWLNRIKRLYRCNRKRIEAKDDPERFAAAQREVCAVLAEISGERGRELASTNWWLNDSRSKALESLKNHWDGLTLFLTDTDIPLDTNMAERLFRFVANFRKNCFGVHSRNFGHLTAMLLSIFATLRLNGVSPRLFLTEYFAAVAQADGDAERVVKHFLPWNLPEEHRQRLAGAPERKDTS